MVRVGLMGQWWRRGSAELEGRLKVHMLRRAVKFKIEKPETEQGDGWSKFEVEMRRNWRWVGFRDRVRERVHEHISLRRIEEWSRSCA